MWISWEQNIVELMIIKLLKIKYECWLVTNKFRKHMASFSHFCWRMYCKQYLLFLTACNHLTSIWVTLFKVYGSVIRPLFYSNDVWDKRRLPKNEWRHQYWLSMFSMRGWFGFELVKLNQNQIDIEISLNQAP